MKKEWVIIALFVAFFLHGAEIKCDFRNKSHLQGVADGDGAVYWVFTDVIVKSDFSGKVLKKVPLHRMPGGGCHGGDPCFANGKLYIPYNGSGFNKFLKDRPNINFIQQYSADLKFEKNFPVPDLEFGAGAVAWHDGRFFVAGGRPAALPGNAIYEYDRDFRLIKKHELDFSSRKGIQTLTTDGRYWYIGVYNSPAATFVTDMDFAVLGKWKISCSVGLLHLSDGRKLKARSVKFRKEKVLRFGGALLELAPENMKLYELSEQTAKK